MALNKTPVSEQKDEIITEVSKKTLSSYIRKADDSVRSLSRKTVVGGTPEEKKEFYDKNDKKVDKRLASMDKAVKKMKDKDATNESMGLIQSIAAELTEGKNAFGERTFQTYNAWKRAIKAIKPDAEFTGDKDIDQVSGLGEWDGATGVIYGSSVMEAQQLIEARSTALGQFVNSLKSHPMVDSIVDAHYLSDGITALLRLKDGNAYEVEVRAAPEANNFQEKRKASQYKERNDKKLSKVRANWDSISGLNKSTV